MFWRIVFACQGIKAVALSKRNTFQCRPDNGTIHLKTENLSLDRVTYTADIGYYVMQLFNLEKDDNEYKAKLESFLNGYVSITPISGEEKRIIPFLSTSIYFFYLGIQSLRFDNRSNVFLNEIYMERFIKLIIKRWADYNKLFHNRN